MAVSAVTATELGYLDGVTSNIQTQLNGKANASALAAYALKDGSNASGTWPISVSGSSNTLISTTDTAISNYVRYRSVSGTPSLVGSTAGGGAWGLPSTGPDAEYANGQILRLGWSPEYYTDIFTGPNDFGSAAGIQFRQIVDGKMASRGWRTLLDTANYAGYLDTRYLQKSSYTASDILAKLKTVDGSGSGLDADLLDGYQSTSFNLATNLGACQDYGVYVIGLMQITDYTTAGNMANGTLIFIRQNGNNPAQKIIYSLSTRYNTDNVRFGYLTLSTNIYVLPCTFTYNGKKWAGFQVSSASSYSTGVVCVRDGLRLGEWSTPFLLKYAVSNTGAVINSEVNSSVVINGADIIESGVYSNVFFGNASSATKLATARSIWGQSFDGTQGVDGHLYLGSPTYRLYFGTSGRTGFLTGADGRFQIYNCDNTAAVNSLFAINLTSGNVGIGTTSPGYKLSVVGTGNFTGRIFAQQGVTIGTTDDIGWYFSSGRIVAGQSVARGVNVGSLLVSGAWADYTKVPTNGIYSKGDIYSMGAISCRGADSQAADASSGIDSNALWNVLGAVGTEKINASHLPDCSKTLTCSTAAGTAAKVVTCTGFQLTTGAAVTVRFTSGNSAASPTLNVNGTGAKGIRVYRGTSLVTPFANWNAYATLEMVYNGTYWVITGNPVVYSLNAASASDSSGTYYRTARIFADGWKEYAFVTNASGNDRTLAMPYAFSSVNSMGVVVTLFGTSPGAGNVKSKSTSSVTVDFSTGTASTSKRGTVLCFGY